MFLRDRFAPGESQPLEIVSRRIKTLPPLHQIFPWRRKVTRGRVAHPLHGVNVLSISYAFVFVTNLFILFIYIYIHIYIFCSFTFCFVFHGMSSHFFFFFFAFLNTAWR